MNRPRLKSFFVFCLFWNSDLEQTILEKYHVIQHRGRSAILLMFMFITVLCAWGGRGKLYSQCYYYYYYLYVTVRSAHGTTYASPGPHMRPRFTKKNIEMLFFIPLEYKFLLLTSEIFCLWGKQKSLVLAGLGIYKFIEKNKFLKIYTNFWRTHMRPRWRICVTRRGRICVLGDAYAGSTELIKSGFIQIHYFRVMLSIKWMMKHIH